MTQFEPKKLIRRSLDGLSTAENKSNKKRNTDIKYLVFRFGGEYRIRTGHLFTASEAL